MTKKRARRSGQLLPAAAAMTVAGLLVGGAGTVINTSAAAPSGPIADNQYDSTGLSAADRATSADRADRAADRAATTASQPAAVKPATGRVIDMGTCDASFYDQPQLTADGEMFDPNALTAAHRTLPFNTRVRVTNVTTGKSVIVRINDRGPFIDDRCLDLSKAAFGSIANLSSGVVDVRYEVLVQDAT
jgi:rare lipoprotein A